MSSAATQTSRISAQVVCSGLVLIPKRISLLPWRLRVRDETYAEPAGRTPPRRGRARGTGRLAFVTTWGAGRLLAVRLYRKHSAENQTRGSARGAPLFMAKIKVEGTV